MACGDPLSSWSLFRGSSSHQNPSIDGAKNDEVVSCLACGVYAHRKCVFRKQSMPICQVNRKLIEERMRYTDEQQIHPSDSIENNQKCSEIKRDEIDSIEPIEKDRYDELEDDYSTDQKLDPSINVHHSPSNSNLPESTASPTLGSKQSTISPPMSVFSDIPTSASEESVDDMCKQQHPSEVDANIVDVNTTVPGSKDYDDTQNEETSTQIWSESGPPNHWASLHTLKGLKADECTGNNDSPSNDDEDETAKNDDELLSLHDLGRVSEALEENVFAHFTQSKNDQQEKEKDSDSNEVMNALLEEKAAKPPPPTKQQKVIQNISRTMQIARKTTKARKAMGIASVAGGVVGGVAGLVLAGPAGAYVGLKLGQVAGVAGVVIEGTLGVGVLVAGVAGTMITVNQLKSGEKRILTLGEGQSKVALVRPNITIDPVWEGITASARRSAPKEAPVFIRTNQKVSKRERMRRDAVIVNSDETEIETSEKVSLLIFSSLNDKSSLPGHVYRELIKEHHSRVRKRFKEKLTEHSPDSQEAEGHERIVRDDTHAIIKHVTATLLETRPGFSSSTRITEISATAVETIVFGEVYEAVYDEIIAETRETDNELMVKISNFESERAKNYRDSNKATVIENMEGMTSHDALTALRMLPESYSVAEKLLYCVKFLEAISNQFSAMDSDSLLELVCQHIVVAKVPNLNAEIVFLEEFARDEQLLRGREGYALVTMQASLHFMNASSDFEKDIFHADDKHFN